MLPWPTSPARSAAATPRDANGDSADLYNINGSLTDTFGGNWGVEATGGYHNLSNTGIGRDLDIWNVGGSAFWANVQGRLAATVNYYSTSAFRADLHVTSYGAGGEFYAGPSVTLAVKGGGNTVDVSGFGGSGSDSGGYAGGMAQWYPMPNLSLSGSVDYAEFSFLDATSETFKAEYLASETLPVSVYAGYEHVEYNTSGFGLGGDGDLFSRRAWKFYMNGSDSGTLVDRQRSGSLGYIAQAPILGLSTN